MCPAHPRMHVGCVSEIGANPIEEKSAGRPNPQRSTIIFDPGSCAEPQIKAFLSDLAGQRNAQFRHDVLIVLGHVLYILIGVVSSPKLTTTARFRKFCRRFLRMLRRSMPRVIQLLITRSIDSSHASSAVKQALPVIARKKIYWLQR